MKLHISEMREKIGMSQKELADKLGVSAKTEWNWEAGKSFPNAESIWDMCVLFGTDPSELMGWWDVCPRHATSGTTLSLEESELVGCYRDSTPGQRDKLSDYARERRAFSKTLESGSDESSEAM